MKYVAFLRGVNVGGNSRVEMKTLKSVMERLGFTQVTTYINSGNVLFSSTEKSTAKITDRISRAITEEFGFDVPVLVKTDEELLAIAGRIPLEWCNDTANRCDVLLLWESVDSPKTLKSLPLREGVDSALYTPGAIIWHLDRTQISKSGMHKIIGTELYKNITIRNCNTMRTLAEKLCN